MRIEENSRTTFLKGAADKIHINIQVIRDVGDKRNIKEIVTTEQYSLHPTGKVQYC